jgi:hypothetical protein
MADAGFQIEVGEKFASLVLSPGVRTSFHTSKPISLGNGLWLSETPPLKLDRWLRCQLGEIICEFVRNSTFVLTAKQQSARPENLDIENQALCDRLHFFVWGMAITAGPPLIERGFIFSGGRIAQGDDEGLIRNVRQFRCFYQTPGVPEPQATPEGLRKAVRFSERWERIHADVARYYRLANGLGAFQTALEANAAISRHHQFVRSIESFLPASVFGQKKFSEYATKLLRGCAQVERVLREMYDLRSAAEHHRRFDAQKLRRVADPEAVAGRLTRQAEAFARELFRRFFAEDEDCSSHFVDERALASLWSNPEELERVWGAPFNIDAIS